jgi:DNA-binding winged helix-turn-helix (wHTH) protein
MAMAGAAHENHIHLTPHVIDELDVIGWVARAVPGVTSMATVEFTNLQQPGAVVIRFAAFAADLHTGELRRNGRKIRLPNQSFVALSMLVTRPGQLVTREELRARLWPADTLVEYEQGLNAAINRLREALGDCASDPKFIETLPRRGYRFIAPVDSGIAPEPPAAVPAVEAAPAADAAENPAPDRSRSRSIRTMLLFAAAGLCAAALLIALMIRLAGDTKRSALDSMNLKLAPFTSLPGEERAPAFAPDGNAIAFAWNGDPHNHLQFDLYVKSMDSERMLRLTNEPARWISPAWSPDGTQIAFARSLERRGVRHLHRCCPSYRPSRPAAPACINDGISAGPGVVRRWNSPGRRE